MQTRSRSKLSKASQGWNVAYDGSTTSQTVAGDAATSRREIPSSSEYQSTLQSLDSGSQIELWRESATSDINHESEGMASRLLRACLDSLACLMTFLNTSSISKRENNLLRRCQATLKLWADGHNVWNGKLDRTLDQSKNLQHMTLSVLNQLCGVLLNGIKKHAAKPPRDANDLSILEITCKTAEIYGQTKWLLEEPDDCACDSESESESDGDTTEDEAKQTGLAQIIDDIKIYTDCLVDLNAALDCPAIDPVHDDEPTVLKVEQRAAHDYHSELIRAKYPQANLELVECLGMTSWNRYQRMQQQRESNVYAQTHVDTTTQSTAKSQAANSEFKDSGLGTSLPSAQTISYAETIISFMTSINGGSRVKIPPLSAEAKQGVKFECNACGTYIRVTNDRDWRKHLFLDIQPYTCFYASCSFSSKPFADQQLWSRHLELDHNFGPQWDRVDCPLCLETTESGKNSILIHFARHMEDIALAVLPREIESDADSDDSGTVSDSTTSSHKIGSHEKDGNNTIPEPGKKPSDLYLAVTKCMGCLPRPLDKQSSEIIGSIGDTKSAASRDQIGKIAIISTAATPSPVLCEAPQVSKLLDSATNFTVHGAVSEESKGQNVHKCRCGKRFTRAIELKRHVQTAHEKNRHICDFPTCWASFETMVMAQRHRGWHYAKYNCLFPPCGHVSMEKRDCREHMETAHRDQYGRLTRSSKSFSQRYITSMPTRRSSYWSKSGAHAGFVNEEYEPVTAQSPEDPYPDFQKWAFKEDMLERRGSSLSRQPTHSEDGYPLPDFPSHDGEPRSENLAELGHDLIDTEKVPVISFRSHTALSHPAVEPSVAESEDVALDLKQYLYDPTLDPSENFASQGRTLPESPDLADKDGKEAT